MPMYFSVKASTLLVALGCMAILRFSHRELGPWAEHMPYIIDRLTRKLTGLIHCSMCTVQRWYRQENMQHIKAFPWCEPQDAALDINAQQYDTCMHAVASHSYLPSLFHEIIDLLYSQCPRSFSRHIAYRRDICTAKFQLAIAFP